MLESLIGAVVFALIAFIIALILVASLRENDNKGRINMAIILLLMAGLFTVISAGISGIEMGEGLPVGHNHPHLGSSNLPPEDIVQLIKTVDHEYPENIVYLNLVPYNNVNGTRMLYRISISDDVATPIDFRVGMKIVNNNGVIEQV